MLNGLPPCPGGVQPVSVVAGKSLSLNWIGDLADYLDIAACGFERWNNIWGDPILSGTVFMVVYAAAAVLVLRVARVSAGRERWFWGLCGLFFVFQVINTHLDLHAVPAAIGHCLAKAQGWYDQRGPVKLVAAAGLAAVLLVLLLVLLIVFRRNIAGNMLLVVGVSMVAGFTLIKGIGFNAAEQYYHQPVGPFRIADFIEFSGIVVAMIAALRR